MMYKLAEASLLPAQVGRTGNGASYREFISEG